MSGLGWCVHPQRRVSHDLKIMVRRGELGCRDGWSRDLWAPASETNVAGAPEAPLTGPVRPVSPEEMSYLVASNHVRLEATGKGQSSSPVDVVVGETSAMSDAEDRATLLSHDTRAAIEAARKRHLASLQVGSLTDDLTSVVSSPTSESGSAPNRSSMTPLMSAPATRFPVGLQSSSSAFSPRYNRDVAPVRPDEVPRDQLSLATSPAGEKQFSSVPDLVDGFELPRAGGQERALPVAGDYENDIEIAPTRVRTARRWPIGDDDLDASAVELANAYSTDIQLQRSGEPPAPSTSVDDDWQFGAEDADYDLGEVWEAGRSRRRRWQPSLRFERPSRGRVVERVVDEWDDSSSDEQALAEAVEDVRFLPDPAFDWREPDEPFEAKVETSPLIPRMCRTCRDFRPADNGGRGWCTNKWAFSHRRMVDSDELPCETSLGCWWLPHDEVWLAEADAAAHTEPTPLVDHWLERKVGVATATGTRRR